MEAKAWYQSKTILGVLALVGVVLFQRFGLEEITRDDLTEILVPLGTLIAAVVAVVGRVQARKEIKLTKPGGPFNPHAEVRKAQPVQGRGPGAKGRGGLRKGYAQISVVGAMVSWILCGLVLVFVLHSCAPVHAGSAWRVERYPDITETPDLGGWLRCVEVEDERPFLVRLWESLSWSSAWKVQHDPETGAVSARLAKIELRGGATW